MVTQWSLIRYVDTDSNVNYAVDVVVKRDRVRRVVSDLRGMGCTVTLVIHDVDKDDLR